MKIGIIGTGNMGTILIDALIDGNATSPSNLVITNRTMEKAEKLKHKYEEITVETKVENVIKYCDLILICVKPQDIFPIIYEHKNDFTKEKCLVSITSPIPPQWLEQVVSSSCARIIPSITNRALSGVSLFTFGEKCSTGWRTTLLTLFSPISTPVIIEEEVTRVASDIVSCGPAFYSYLTRRLIDAAVEETAIDYETATKLVEHMLIGLGELLKKGVYSLPTLEEKVCVKGGITGEGIKVLESEVDGIFEKVFQATHKKYFEEVNLIKKSFQL